MVGKKPSPVPRDWARWPLPSVVVEVISPTTRRRDHMHKRDFYLEIGVPEYWIVDAREREIRVVKRDVEDEVTSETLLWSPVPTAAPLRIDVQALFADEADDE